MTTSKMLGRAIGAEDLQLILSVDRGFGHRGEHGYWCFFSRCVCSGLCQDLVTLSEEFYRECLCLTVCDLGTSTNSRPSLQFGCSTTERK